MRTNARVQVSIFFGSTLIIFLSAAPNGWCERARGVFALDTPGGAISDQVLSNPNVDGIALLFLWNRIEPEEGRFKWESIDAQIKRVRESGKLYSLGVTPGINTPDWVYQTGARSFNFRWDKPWGQAPCSLARFPVPWDAVYLSKWRAFIRALGTRYAHDPRLVLLKIQGVNAQTPEFLLPHDRPGNGNASRLVNCTPSDEVAEWLQVGYRPAKITQAWEISAMAFGNSFPEQELAIETGPWGMPPINDSGHLIPNRATDVELPIAIISTGKRALDGRFVVQNDGLKATWGWPQLQQLASPEPVAFQMAWKVTDDPACRMNNFVRPCDPREMLKDSINRGIAAGAAYLEIYQADLLNPALNQTIAEAHQRLLSHSDH